MKAHEGTLRHMEREALNRGEGEIERTENPGAIQYFVKKSVGKSHRYIEADPFDGIDLDAVPLVGFRTLTEWNAERAVFHKTERGTNCSARVYCPTCRIATGKDVLMVYESESILSDSGNMPAKRQVRCRECGRRGNMLL